jgi:hypothetical protein
MRWATTTLLVNKVRMLLNTIFYLGMSLNISLTSFFLVILVSEDGAKDFDKPMDHPDCSPVLNNTNGEKVIVFSAKVYFSVNLSAILFEAESPDHSFITLSTLDKEKDDPKDVDVSEVLNVPLISNGGDDKMDSHQTKTLVANEELDEKNRVSLQDQVSTQDDHVMSNLRRQEG